MKISKCLSAVLAAALVCGVASSASAAVFWFSNTPYLSQADIPAGFYAGGSPTVLEDFEDGALDSTITATAASWAITPSGNAFTDSVDGDDGNLDGSGINGRSYVVFPSGQAGPSVRFDFSGQILPTAAALVWTDGIDGMIFKAYDAANNLLGSFTPGVSFADGSFTGGTAEDRFFGVTYAGGIKAISIENSNPFAGIEVDHIQYGYMVPEPGSIAIFLAFAGFGLFARWRRRRAG